MANQHIVRRGAQWAIRAENATRDTRVVEKQSEAIECGRQIARNQASELIIHRRDGRIRARDSYGNDPFPPKN
jgi:uncharacterized protein YdaT